MTCVECGSIMVKTATGGGRCANCNHVTDEPFKPITVYDLGVGGVAILDAELIRVSARITALEKVARALLLFHSAGPWDRDKATEWSNLTGSNGATTKVLCDLARSGLASGESA